MSGWWVIGINYLIGSLPFGVIIGWLLRGIDIRKYGSGNIGATNVSRVLGFTPALLAGIADALKGFLGAYLATRFIQNPFLWFLAVFMIVIGHNWSVFLRFKGGKGVATTVGILFYLSYQAAIISFLSWIGMVLISRYSSLGSLTGALLMPIGLYLFNKPPEIIWWGIFACALVFLRHSENIKRLVSGKEHKIGKKGRE
ncbi:MAG: glycerol-3-phosphate 1-O-acyltransferase PlsY [Atribacter sp.]|jgi:glycerol-3-phosphate acyltransferase PlsY|uniref:glycerol-3-phosphate 1-O-acyltransferase PlsY n=1 Tax=Atribacter sp. TaxID=2847780 RepID=UPI00176C2A57|nr:glycerol-3-phosphate 1-O-acyltransferase PlsY [Atribacterota bacterium]HHT10809.1 glycerol-3-phosphate 1-O-acyltransferase PlsY [Candidatus Atribacteria bacterium]